MRCQDKARALAMKVLDLKNDLWRQRKYPLATRLVGNYQHLTQKTTNVREAN